MKTESVKNGKEKELTPREVLFLKAYFSGMSETDSFLHVRPETPRLSAGAQGCKMLKAIKAKMNWGELMDAAGLGDARLLQELTRHLKMKKVTFWQGQEIEGDFEDATVQLKATEILADLLGKRKHALELLGPGGEPLSIKYEIVKPEEEEDGKETS